MISWLRLWSIWDAAILVFDLQFRVLDFRSVSRRVRYSSLHMCARRNKSTPKSAKSCDVLLNVLTLIHRGKTAEKKVWQGSISSSIPKHSFLPCILFLSSPPTAWRPEHSTTRCMSPLILLRLRCSRMSSTLQPSSLGCAIIQTGIAPRWSTPFPSGH